MEQRQKVLDHLNRLGISYELVEHPAVYTIEEMDAINIDDKNEIVKNLFVRDDKKKRYFLIVLQKDKRADLKELRRKLDCKPLTFASEADLGSYLGLTKGAVTPLGIINDEALSVEVVLDKDIMKFERMGVHPNDNTATVWIRPADLVKVIQKNGNGVTYIEL